MILFGPFHFQWFSDKTFEHLELKSGMLDVYSGRRKRADKIGRPPPTLLIERAR
jgi:hypothetical protein